MRNNQKVVSILGGGGSRYSKHGHLLLLYNINYQEKMKLISTPKQIEKEFLRMQHSYSNYYWMTAWASSKSEPFQRLVENQDKIRKVIVGIHFYQTHPDFIAAFLSNKRVRYILQPSGVFHPKVFLFYNDENDWELLTGSANFTNAAFTENTEALTLIGTEDIDATEILDSVFNLIDDVWIKSKPIPERELSDYRKVWKNLKSKRESLSGNYGKKRRRAKPIRPLHQVSIIKMDWRTFFKKVKSEKGNRIDSRIKVIETARSLFTKERHFHELGVDERRFIAGIPNNLPVDDDADWAFFGSMKGAGKFQNRIIENDRNISRALDEIPVSGQITKFHYLKFLEFYKKVFEGNYLATATRLLTMKRPDVFVCLDSKNKTLLCEDFGIAKTGMDYERYWDEVIERIYVCDWWINPDPKTEKEKRVSNSRAAFLDALYYEE